MNNFRLLAIAIAVAGFGFAQTQTHFVYASGLQAPMADTTKKDSIQYETTKGLPLKPQRKINFITTEGTWTSVDISPDGKTIVFDMMGDLYTMPVTGGTAKAITKGIAFDCSPKFCPDGKRIAFISDRSGAENIWYIDMDKQDTVQLTKEKNQNFSNLAYTPDGDYIVYSKGRRIPKLYLMHKDGGAGTQLFDEPAAIKVIDPAVSADGRYVYFSRRSGAWNYNAQLPQYELGLYDRQNGKTTITFTSRYGSAFTPVLSKDGNWLVYGSRYEDKTGLIIRNLKTGEENWLAYPVQRDDQESIATMGVLPGMAFMPDSKSLLASYGGKIYNIPINGNKATEIAYTADLKLEMGPQLSFKYPINDTLKTAVTQIRDAVPSPDGKKLAFTALNRLYLMDYPNGTPVRLTNNNYTEAQPAWSKDGNALVFITWTARGGDVVKITFNKAKATAIKLNKEPGMFMSPVFTNEGDKIVFERSTIANYKESIGPNYNDALNEICWIPAAGGEIKVIDNARGRYNPHFINGSDRIYLNSGNGNLVSVEFNGKDETVLARITGITPFGSSVLNNHEAGRGGNRGADVLEEDAMEPEQKPNTAGQLNMSPDGKRVLAQVFNEIYVIDYPKTGKVVNISVADATNAAFPARKLTEFGGEFPSWEADSKKIHYSLGNAHFVYDVTKAATFDHSVAVAKKADTKRKADSIATAKKDTSLANKNLALKDTTKKAAAAEEPRYKAIENEVAVYYIKDIPTGLVLIKNARIVTMNGDEVIENGDILVVNNRIKAVGKTGTLSVAANTKTVDATGKTVIPGFVDTHAHMWPQWGIHKNQVWIYAANLAYGVTTTRDPQTATTDVLTYADMVDAGMMEGPRIYSTGPGVGYWGYNIKDSAQAETILQQYSKYYHTKYIKMYLTGNRQQRQWIIMAAKNQQILPTTEGGLDFKFNMTNLLDGYPGHEHAIPIYPLYHDVIKTIADSKMAVTPTLIVSYGGPWAENYYYETEKPYHDKKLQYFTPYEELAEKSRRRPGWFMDEEQVFPKHAKSMKQLVEAKGLAGIGSHGQLQGLGYHWELWAIQSGGMKPHDALKVATILGATSLGLDGDVGSLQPGKLADLIILDKNPLMDIRNSNSVIYVMKNGRLYDGATCNEIVTGNKQLVRDEWEYKKPVVTTTVID